MAIITPERILIYQQDTQYKAAVSETTLTSVGATTNFINTYQANMREFMINGPYSQAVTPFNIIEGIVKFPFNWELVDCYIYVGQSAGTSGQTILDLKWKPFSSGSYASIFSTTPKFTNSAGAGETCGIGQTKTGFTAPVLNKTQFDAHDQLRLDLLQSVVGGFGCGIGITFRPR